MTDRIYAISVALKDDIRVDDIEPIIEAIKMIRGVLAVQTHISDISQWTTTERVRSEIGEKLWSVLYPKFGVKD